MREGCLSVPGWFGYKLEQQRSAAVRHSCGGLAILVMLLAPGVTMAAGTNRFDGNWDTILSCANARDALGYSFRFVSTVKNGVLHGVHGSPGQPSSLEMDGTIGADGTGKLYAKGRTGSREYVPGRDAPRGTEYFYTIEARFEGSTGSGTRVEGRSCTVQFARE